VLPHFLARKIKAKAKRGSTDIELNECLLRNSVFANCIDRTIISFAEKNSQLPKINGNEKSNNCLSK
jgi:hypothetical protein